MKFLSGARVREVQGKQVVARECYVQELKNEVREVRMVKASASNEASPPPSKLIDHEVETKDEKHLKRA